MESISKKCRHGIKTRIDGVENKKLTEILTVMGENYNALRTQLLEYMSKNPEKELSPISKKRKSESSHNTTTNSNNIVNEAVNGNSESSFSDGESFKKSREEG
ncbi:hypothetical protein ACFX13_025899 [Malus domestica]|uniref:Uncharacterized protein n=1 Tax=Malus domestica TaxID=3750 RepID=A0A498HCS1_MALDO|nr:hypothetical protein DVH24_031172 [Malus domestica]